MSTDTAAQHSSDHEADHDAGHDAAGHEPGHDHGMTDLGYVKIALFLVVVTGAEVALSYMVEPLGVFFMPLLFILMAVKFFTVVSYFMHLKFDSRIFTAAFYSGLVLAVAVYIVTLLTFDPFV